jgi:hypothetical protein
MIKELISVMAAALAIGGGLGPSAALAAGGGDSVANARDATAGYADPAAALAAGYELLTDAAGLACIDQPGQGAMGIHYVKGALVQAGTVDPARPQALVYQRTPEGRLRLAALEYVVLQDGWDAAHGAPPRLFGQEFMLTPAGNRYGLPAFYSLHAWLWQDNPTGLFSMWNPGVRCAGPEGADQGHAGQAELILPDG